MIKSFTYHITTHLVEETQKLGKTIGRWAKAGTVLALTGDLGSGKTAFVQGLAKGLEVPNNFYVTSPSYTLINEYPGRLTLFHVDLYRIENTLRLEDIGLDEILDSNGVIAIEWAEKFSDIDHIEHLALQFEIINNKSRNICFATYGIDAENLFSELIKI